MEDLLKDPLFEEILIIENELNFNVFSNKAFYHILTQFSEIRKVNIVS